MKRYQYDKKKKTGSLPNIKHKLRVRLCHVYAWKSLLLQTCTKISCFHGNNPYITYTVQEVIQQYIVLSIMSGNSLFLKG